MAVPPTQKQQLDAAWDRLKAWNNVSMPVFYARLVRLIARIR